MESDWSGSELKQFQAAADGFGTIDDIINEAREIAKRGHRVGAFESRNAFEAYCDQHAQVVVYVGLGTGEEYEIVFRACAPILSIDTRTAFSDEKTQKSEVT